MPAVGSPLESSTMPESEPRPAPGTACAPKVIVPKDTRQPILSIPAGGEPAMSPRRQPGNPPVMGAVAVRTPAVAVGKTGADAVIVTLGAIDAKPTAAPSTAARTLMI